MFLSGQTGTTWSRWRWLPSVYQLRSIDITLVEQVNLLLGSRRSQVPAVAQWCDLRVQQNGVEEVHVALRRIQRKLMALEGFFRALEPRSPRRVDAISWLRSQAVDVTDPVWLENMRLAAGTFGPVPHEVEEAGEGEWDQENRPRGRVGDCRGNGNNEVLQIVVARTISLGNRC